MPACRVSVIVDGSLLISSPVEFLNARQRALRFPRSRGSTTVIHKQSGCTVNYATCASTKWAAGTLGRRYDGHQAPSGLQRRARYHKNIWPCRGWMKDIKSLFIFPNLLPERQQRINCRVFATTGCVFFFKKQHIKKKFSLFYKVLHQNKMHKSMSVF